MTENMKNKISILENDLQNGITYIEIFKCQYLENEIKNFSTISIEKSSLKDDVLGKALNDKDNEISFLSQELRVLGC